jgi:hypothetical protein
MENINNIPFSFDRNTSKWLAKLGISNANSSFSEGINLTNVIIDHDNKYEIPFTYTLKDGSTKTIILRPTLDKDDGDFRTNYIGALSLNSNLLPTDAIHHTVHFSLEKDIYKNHEAFEIKSIKVDSEDLSKFNAYDSATDPNHLYATITQQDVNLELGDAEWGITLPMDAKFAG